MEINTAFLRTHRRQSAYTIARFPRQRLRPSTTQSTEIDLNRLAAAPSAGKLFIGLFLCRPTPTLSVTNAFPGRSA
jgi:hypothetical protein